MGHHARGDGVHVVLAVLDVGIVLARRSSATSSHSTIAWRSAFDLVALASILRGRFARHLEAVAEDPLDAVPREEAGLLGDFVRRADVDAAAEPGVLALGVLAHADHVDVGRRAVRERRRQAGKQPHRPQVDVLLKALAQRQQQIPHRDVIGNRRRSRWRRGRWRRMPATRSNPSSSIIRPCVR